MIKVESIFTVMIIGKDGLNAYFGLLKFNSAAIVSMTLKTEEKVCLCTLLCTFLSTRCLPVLRTPAKPGVVLAEKAREWVPDSQITFLTITRNRHPLFTRKVCTHKAKMPKL